MSGMAFASYVRVLFGWGPNNVSITDRFTYAPQRKWRRPRPLRTRSICGTRLSARTLLMMMSSALPATEL